MPKEEEQIDVKIGTKEEVYWTEIQEKTEKEIESLERMLKFNKAIWEMCEDKLKLETERRCDDNGDTKTD